MDAVRQINRDIRKLRFQMFMTQVEFRIALALNSFKQFIYS